MNFSRIYLLLAITFLSWIPLNAQRIAIKTNTIDWVLMSPNLSLETRLSSRLTFDIGIAGNPMRWSPYGSDIMLRNFRIEPELRYWFNRPMARHFMGFALLGGPFDLQLKEHRYQGNIAAFGITYGYALVLGRNWNVEFSTGIGLGRLWGFDYKLPDSRPESKNMSKWIPVPIRANISFSYIFH